MKITVKEVSGAKFELDGVSGATSVTELKGMIEKVKGWAPSTQKLVFSGRILADDKKLSDYDWQEKEGAFIVVMISKKRPEAAMSSAASASTPATAPKPAAAAAAPVKPAAAPAPSAPSPANPASPAQASPAPQPVSQSLVKESDVAQLKDMGFPEDQVRAALAAAFGNTDRAVEYLMNGIPEGIPTPMFNAPASPAAPAPAVSGQSASTSAGGVESEFPLLLSKPQILSRLRAVSRENPQALAQYIQELRGTNPEIIEEINKNRNGFLQLMREPVTTLETADEADDMMEAEGDYDDVDPAGMMERFVQEFQSMSQEERSQAAAAMGVNPNEMQALVQMMGSLPPEAIAQLMQSAGGMGGGHQTIHLTQAEVDAVDRLQELGFSRQACLEAYLACDKNEELAANYLFSNPPMDDDM